MVSAASWMRTSWRPESQIAQLRSTATSVLLTTDWLVGWRFLKVYRYTHTHTLFSASSPQFSLAASLWFCGSVCACGWVCVSPVGPCSGWCWPAWENRGGEGEWKSQLKERSLVCLLECLWEPLTVNLSYWRVRKRERNEGEDGEEKTAREIRHFDFNGPSVLEWSCLICLSFSRAAGFSSCQTSVLWGTNTGKAETTWMWEMLGTDLLSLNTASLMHRS